ncbi:MAG: Gfo/Idh/MocA family oxidoreductase [Erysipelotrichaceae bacterium]|nr:Gfo/Idh/MocA family oxidoreductase [Erysipelotrichaceae bacterium]
MKVGVIGTSIISESFVDSCRLCEVDVNAVYNRRMARASEFAEKKYIGAAYNNYDALLSEADVDTVYIALPNHLHFSYAKRALKAGKNVLIEKPFCSNLKEFNDLAVTARNNKVFIIEMDRVTCLPNFQVLKMHLDEIAPVRAVTMSMCKVSRKYDAYKRGEVADVFKAEGSGGALVDLGVYAVNLTTALLGMPENLIYVADKNPEGVDLTGNLIMKYPETITSILVSKNSNGRNEVTVQGENGTLFVDGPAQFLDKITLVKKDSSEVISYEQDYRGQDYTVWEMKRIIDNRDEAGFEMRLAQSRKVLKVLCSARKSAGIVFAADQK